MVRGSGSRECLCPGSWGRSQPTEFYFYFWNYSATIWKCSGNFLKSVLKSFWQHCGNVCDGSQAHTVLGLLTASDGWKQCVCAFHLSVAALCQNLRFVIELLAHCSITVTDRWGSLIQQVFYYSLCQYKAQRKNTAPVLRSLRFSGDCDERIALGKACLVGQELQRKYSVSIGKR